MAHRFALLSAFLLCTAACGSSSEGTTEGPVVPVDAGGAKTDAASPVLDASTPETDAGSTVVDASMPAADASTPPIDASTPRDSGAPTVDAGTPRDSGSPVVDAGSSPVDAGPACHTLSFGQPESIFIGVPASQLGTLTGGTIVDGTYDLVAVETSSSASSSFTLRSTWRFSGNTIQMLDQLKTTSLGPVTNRSGSIAVSGATISRTFTCGSSDVSVATLNYDSKIVGGIQTIRVMSGTLRLTFEKRP
jgi:hypothetical protein